MRKLIATSIAGLALGTSMIAAVAPADAQRWHGGYRGGGYRGGWHGGYRGYYGGGGAAVAAGIIGLGVGAAIASDRGYYGRGYYGGGYGYGYPSAYYDAPPPGYYGSGYCRSDWRWDGYRDRYVRVRYCD